MTLIAFTGLIGCLWLTVVTVAFCLFWTEPVPAKPKETYSQGMSAVLSAALGVAGFLLAMLSIVNWWRG